MRNFGFTHVQLPFFKTIGALMFFWACIGLIFLANNPLKELGIGFLKAYSVYLVFCLFLSIMSYAAVEALERWAPPPSKELMEEENENTKGG